jgi:hypothetical protein
MSVKVDYNILNQKGTPAFFSDVLANRPAFGFAGRVFISTDSGQIFEDTGTAWNLIADAGVGGGTLSSVCVNGNTTATGIVITAGGLSTNSLTDTTLTSGSVLFATSGGAISQDNTNLFWDNTNKWLGIGTAPSSPFDIHSAGSASMLALNNTGGNASNIIFLNASVNKWRIGNTASNTFDLFNNQIGTTALSFSGSNSAATFINSVTATAHITTGGTSSQFVKGNGTLDSSVYITLANLSATTPLSYNNSTGAFTILQSGASQSGYLSSTDWNTFNNKASLSSLSATTPLSYNSSTGAFTIQVANSGQSGYLTSTDWNTFNNKQATLTFGNLTEEVSSVLSITGGTNAVIGTGTTIQIKQSSASQSGYLSSTDWTTFNNKASALNGTGFVKASGTTITYDNSTYYLASNPNNYIALTGLSATSPLSYNNTSGGFSISQATTSANGYLSSTDWNTFNNKLGYTGSISTNQVLNVIFVGGIPYLQAGTITDGATSVTINNRITSNSDTISVNGTAGSIQIQINNQTATTGKQYYFNSKSTGVLGFGNNTTGDILTFDGTTGTETNTKGLRVTSASGDQQMWIYGTSPAYRLYDSISSPTIAGFVGMATAVNNFIQGTASGDMAIGTSTGGKIFIGTASGTINPQITVTSTNFVGIGTISPQYKMQITNTSANSVTDCLALHNGTNPAGGGTGARLLFKLSNFESSAETRKFASIEGLSTSDYNEDIALVFKTKSNNSDPAEKMRITNVGDLIVGGNVAPQTSSGRGSITINGSSQSILTLAVSNTEKGYLYTTGTDMYVNNSVNGGRLYAVAYNNGVYLASGGVAWIANSDERLKTDLIPIENALNKINTLRTVIGRYKTDEIETKRPFLIAQDLLNCFPEVVNKDEKTGYLGVSYTEIIPLLIAAIKELNDKLVKNNIN